MCGMGDLDVSALGLLRSANAHPVVIESAFVDLFWRKHTVY